MNQSRKWLITGVSSGFGRALAELALARGDTVMGTLRRPEQAADFEALAPGRAHTCIIDMTDRDSLAPVIREALARIGGADVVVNNAGYGMAGAAEELSDDEIRHHMETNFFSLVTVTQEALPHVRAQRFGRFINIASLAGFMGISGMSLYNASKFAVTGFSEGLAGEVAPLGIGVTIVEPGQFRTNWSSPSAIVKARREIPDYAASLGPIRHGITAVDGSQPGDPLKAAEAMIKAADAPKPPLHLALGPDAVGARCHKLAELAGELDAWEAVSLATTLDA